MKKLSKEFKLLSMMRVKNEEEWLEESIISQLPLVDKLIILDDGSTDQTPEVCKSFPRLVEYHYQKENMLDEVRDKNRLLAWALKHQPDWILALDGDEVLEELAGETIIREISLLDPLAPQFTVFYLHFLYMWNKKDYYRIDPGIYSNFWQPRLFSLHKQNIGRLLFKNTDHGGNFHCGSIPANLRWIPRKLDVRVKHYGYFTAEQRRRKYDWYCQHDPQKAKTGYYEHLISEEGLILAKWKERKRSSSASFVKDTGYYQCGREEILNLIPDNSQKILEIGCGHGFLGKKIKERYPDSQVMGVEIDEIAANAAKDRLDRVIIADIEKLIKLPVEYAYFDCIVLGDVLEHLIDPWQVLLKLRRYLKISGELIISLPNVRNIGIINKLLQGKWRYTNAGILDSTHLRFFTFKEIKRILRKLGFNIKAVYTVEGDSSDLVIQGKESWQVIGDSFEWSQLDQKTIQELHTIQFLIRAAREEPLREAGEKGLISVIIPVRNNREITELCIDSLFSYNQEPLEVIIIDNGSDEQMRSYLSGLEEEGIKVINNEKNYGFPAACNQGLRVSRGEYILILNNDVIMGDNCLANMMAHFERESKAGIIAPCSNYVGGKQQLILNYNSLEEFYQVSREYYWEYEGEYMLSYRLAGICLLLKREVIETIGGFDEMFSPGNFEDDDFCLRAAVAGYKNIIARDVYVHHFGSMTFKKEGLDYQQIMKENWNKFKEKWKIPGEVTDRRQLNLALIVSSNWEKGDYYIPL
ncbi:glycosyltransferase [Halocella sp. SP3-1]|uniref:glycosyltransferase n=1 Tax=Halocella sp. SP3-1 TaxID=2382161 RepID=UPI000F75E1FB|nr:glycosyltransferase [Halocella sp. SP3-1]AZO93811.1 glycosyltransferase [Halocella sp. SP3-1]